MRNNVTMREIIIEKLIGVKAHRKLIILTINGVHAKNGQIEEEEAFRDQEVADEIHSTETITTTIGIEGK